MLAFGELIVTGSSLWRGRGEDLGERAAGS